VDLQLRGWMFATCWSNPRADGDGGRSVRDSEGKQVAQFGLLMRDSRQGSAVEPAGCDRSHDAIAIDVSLTMIYLGTC
jgi:hypothetical protein